MEQKISPSLVPGGYENDAIRFQPINDITILAKADFACGYNPYDLLPIVQALCLRCELVTTCLPRHQIKDNQLIIDGEYAATAKCRLRSGAIPIIKINNTDGSK